MDLCRKKEWLVLLGTIVLLCEILSSDGCIEEERRALLDFKASYSNDSLLPSWDPKSNCCAWERVTCDSSSAHIISLSLDALNRNIYWDDVFKESICSTNTTLNWSIFHYFKDLRKLSLSSNCFDGFFHKGDYRSRWTLKKLKTLDLSSNLFNESIVEIISALPSLKNLALASNVMGGHFPFEGLCKKKQLEELDVSYNNFNGTLDICLGNLTSLRILDLSYNLLSGSIPTPSIASLTSLEYLSLSVNKFEGLFSLNIFANHSKLKRLELYGMNSMTFQVETENPPWMAPFQLEHLEIFSCKVNLPTKRIPTFLLYQNSLRYIDISSDNLIGMFPNWLFVNNSKAEVVFLNHNSFTGPFDLNHRMDQLHDIDISKNQIQGNLPNNIGFLFPHLQYFDASNNMFDGNIPASIGEMSSLGQLFLQNNNLFGQIPEHAFNRCISLVFLRMDNNNFNGTLPSGIGKLRLSLLTASNNNFEGAITKELCHLDLTILDLSHNKFSGALPSCFKMPSFIFLRGNSLTGMITEAMTNSSDIQGMDLSDNKFTGTIPKNIYSLEFLTFLLLAGNQLQGQVSNEICHLRNINILDLSRNNFSGSIPSCLNNLSFGEMVSLSHVPFHASSSTTPPVPFLAAHDFVVVQLITKALSLSYKGTVLGNMSALDLSSNQLTGVIPYQIGDLHALHALNLSHNHLNGPIPKSFQKLQSIESLDLSNNNLSGQIPIQLQNLHSLSVFNVSYNNLSGKAPEKGQFGTFDESSYRGNPYLTWSNGNTGNATPTSPTTLLNDGEKNNFAIDFPSFYWSFTASYVMILILMATILWINPYWRRVWLYFVEGCLLKCFGQLLDDVFY